MACRFLKRGALFGFAQSHEATKRAVWAGRPFFLSTMRRPQRLREKPLRGKHDIFVASWLCANK
jgi:hypothetical protein